MKRTTIKDVAKKAGVSITTVSHALSGGGTVKQETRERIRKLAREMNYIPSWSGRNLKSEKTKIIGLYIGHIRGFYGQLAEAMHDQCRDAGYELDIIIADNGCRILDSLLSRRVDGAIILHKDFSDQDAEVLLRTELPAVFLDREKVGPRASCVQLGAGYADCVAGSSASSPVTADAGITAQGRMAASEMLSLIMDEREGRVIKVPDGREQRTDCIKNGSGTSADG